MDERSTFIPPEERESTIEKEQNPEKPIRFKQAIVLGGGMKADPNGQLIGLTLDSKIRVLAAGTLAQQGLATEIVLSGGKTAGADNPSEAQEMQRYLLRKFPELKKFPVKLEQLSIDSIENAKNVAGLIDQNQPAILITNRYHMLRASHNFQKQGIEIEELPAEQIVSERSKHHEKFIREYLQSCDIKKKEAIELALRATVRIDPSGKLLTALAHKLRDGNVKNN